ncbi:zinc ribbon domain-containing protein [Piscirickettsia litoralis]|uniref:DZANK-type domain-containing protein n=1 Tax=Piscirickettsia litoralis TaxID=1891921 RepID=A0ABX3A490_9GAMM|nr:zinc ribbon domain-containing protein [Piscirickettsia litoralis]ODN43263.1 hypothetical protein BGC07_10465 [Piscirickettsia litoralis]
MGHHGKSKHGFLGGIFSGHRRSNEYSGHRRRSHHGREEHHDREDYYRQEPYSEPRHLEPVQERGQRCSSCQADNRINAKFCGQCGVSLVPKDMRCGQCQTTVKAPARFCPECGTAFKANP